LAWAVGPFETDAGAVADRQHDLPEQLLLAMHRRVGGEVTSLLPRVGGVVVRMGRQFRT
jgi:hypothetical protein